MIFFTFYDSITGQITNSYRHADFVVAADLVYPTSSHGVITAVDQVIGDNTALKYVNVATEALIDRPSSGILLDTTDIDADGVDKATLTLIPNPSTANITDGLGTYSIEITDGFLEITSEEADTIEIIIEGAFPTKDITYEVTAT